MAVFGSKSVVEGCKNDVMPYLATVSQCNPTVILKMAAGIDKYVITDFNILSEIRIKRRKHPQ